MVEWSKRIITGIIVVPLLYFVIQNKYICLAMFYPMFIITQLEYQHLIKNILYLLFTNKNQELKEKSQKISVQQQYIDQIHNSKFQYLPSLMYFTIIALFDTTSVNILLISLFLNLMIITLFRIVQFLNLSSKEVGKQIDIKQLYLITFSQIAGDILSTMLFVYPFGFPLIFMNYAENGYKYVFLWLIIAFQSDNGALFAGKLFGKHLFCPKVSPSKTWEGVVGAVAFSTFSSICWYFMKNYIEAVPDFDLQSFAILGCLGGSAALLGDFVESFIKRTSGVKDSGSFFPGHGGMLDRQDSLGFSAPIVFLYIQMFLIK